MNSVKGLQSFGDWRSLWDPPSFPWVLGRRERSLACLLIFSLSCSMPLSICPSHPQTIAFVISWWQCFLCLCHSAPAQLWLVEESYLSSWSSRSAINGDAGPKISQQFPPCLGYMSQWSLDQWPQLPQALTILGAVKAEYTLKLMTLEIPYY